MEPKSNTNPQPTITLQDILKVTQMLSELTHLSRWSELITETGNFPQLGKQALNCAIAFFWGNEISKSGIDVDFSKFPKLALKRGFFKAFLGDIQEENLACILNQAGISEENFQEIVFKKIENNFSPNFSLHLQVDTNSLEAHIYKASSKVATMLEFRRIGKTIDERDYKSKLTVWRPMWSAVGTFWQVLGITTIWKSSKMIFTRETICPPPSAS